MINVVINVNNIDKKSENKKVKKKKKINNLLSNSLSPPHPKPTPFTFMLHTFKLFSNFVNSSSFNYLIIIYTLVIIMTQHSIVCSTFVSHHNTNHYSDNDNSLNPVTIQFKLNNNNNNNKIESKNIYFFTVQSVKFYWNYNF
jgi:hypothetical protein